MKPSVPNLSYNDSPFTAPDVPAFWNALKQVEKDGDARRLLREGSTVEEVWSLFMGHTEFPVKKAQLFEEPRGDEVAPATSAPPSVSSDSPSSLNADQKKRMELWEQRNRPMRNL